MPTGQIRLWNLNAVFGIPSSIFLNGTFFKATTSPLCKNEKWIITQINIEETRKKNQLTVIYYRKTWMNILNYFFNMPYDDKIYSLCDDNDHVWSVNGASVLWHFISQY